MFTAALPSSDIPVVLHFTGRRTGRQCVLPVGCAGDGECFCISTDKHWCHNLRGGREIELTHRGTRAPAYANLLDDPDAMAKAYRVMYPLGPRYATQRGNFGGFAYGRDGEVHREEVVRVRDAGHIIVCARREAE